MKDCDKKVQKVGKGKNAVYMVRGEVWGAERYENVQNYVNKYQMANYRQIVLKFNRKTEMEYINWLIMQQNFGAYIRKKFREDIDKYVAEGLLQVDPETKEITVLAGTAEDLGLDVMDSRDIDPKRK